MAASPQLSSATVVRSHRPSYAPAATSIRRGQRGGVVAVGGLVVVVATLVLGGCVQSKSKETVGQASSAQAVPGFTQSHVDPATPATAIAAQQHSVVAEHPASPEPVISSEDVVRAWFAALDAFVTAGYDGDWDSSKLDATTVQPELGDEESELRWYAAAGLTAVGTPQVEGMQVVELTTTSATVTACLGGIEFVKPSQKNNMLTDIPQTSDEELQVGLIDTSTGWKVRSEVKVGSKCQSQ